MSSRLDDISRRTNVSRATVSRPRTAGLVGLLFPELESPIYPLFAQVIETSLVRQGYSPALCSQVPEGAVEEQYVEMLLDRGACGIIFVAGQHADASLDHSLYQDLAARRLPIVFVNGFAPDIEAPFVSCDDRVAGELAVTHLGELGHRRIGLLSPSDRRVWARRQLAGYRAALESRFGAFDPDLIDVAFPGVAGGYAGASRLVRRGVTAIVCGSDMMALGAIRALRQQGKRVPEDVSVIGYDDSVVMGYTDPPLTTVRQPVQAMGVAAVRSLIDQIHGVTTRKIESLFFPEIVVRASTAPLAGNL